METQVYSAPKLSQHKVNPTLIYSPDDISHPKDSASISYIKKCSRKKARQEYRQKLND